jgi:hypothetical protein
MSAIGWYKCKCGKGGVKLWRLPHFARNELRCAACACADEGMDASAVGDDGRTEWPGGIHTDCVGSWIPAVPVSGDEPFSFWGYTSVPQAGVEWWHFLPTQSSGA